MKIGVLVAVAAMMLAALLAAVYGWWPLGLQFVGFGVWLVVVERSVGLGTFVRFDPSKPDSPTWRRVRLVLGITLGASASAVVVVVATVYPEPGALAIFFNVLLVAYTRWVISYIKAYSAEEEVTLRVRH